MKKTPEIIYLVPDHEDPDYIVWQSDQPGDIEDGVQYIRFDTIADLRILTDGLDIKAQVIIKNFKKLGL